MHRLLTESATPEEVAIVNDLLAQIRRHWELCVAWERWGLDVWAQAHDFSPDNPYTTNYYAAIKAYERHRSRYEQRVHAD